MTCLILKKMNALLEVATVNSKVMAVVVAVLVATRAVTRVIKEEATKPDLKAVATDSNKMVAAATDSHKMVAATETVEVLKVGKATVDKTAGPPKAMVVPQVVDNNPIAETTQCPSLSEIWVISISVVLNSAFANSD